MHISTKYGTLSLSTWLINIHERSKIQNSSPPPSLPEGLGGGVLQLEQPGRHRTVKPKCSPSCVVAERRKRYVALNNSKFPVSEIKKFLSSDRA